MNRIFLRFLVFLASSVSLQAIAQYKPPPRNLQFDTLTWVATWEAPRRVLLDEHFEDVVFPPANWQDTTQGMGWFATSNGSSPALAIPTHTNYAVVNNDLASAGNNGCCDYLITPEINLTQAGTNTLTFNSFFRGWDAESATVEISTDGGNTWELLLQVLPHFTWATLTVDLSQYSGPAGAQHVKIAFKANDNGNANATGWAIDDVAVLSEEIEVQMYGVFLNGTEMGGTSDTTYTFDPNWFPPLAMPPYFCIAAYYDSGYSEMVCTDFPPYYLDPPINLQAYGGLSSTGAAAILTWEPPTIGDYSVSGSLARAGVLTPNMEYSPYLTLHSGNSTSDAMWDELFVYESSGPSQAGIETDGTFIYTSTWSSNVFYKYDLLGNLIESFIIPGVSHVRDMAFDGEYFYGSAADSILFKLDLANKILISTIYTDVVDGIRHIAYDAELDGGNGGFWCGNWESLFSIKMDGNLIQQVGIFNLAACYGSALDPVNQRLWFHDQGGNGVNLWEFDISTLSFTGVFYEPTNLTGFIPYNGIAGGLALTDKVIEGKWVLLGVVQQGNTLIYGLDMGDAPLWTPDDLISYNIYRNNEFLVNVPKTISEYWDLNLAPGSYCYDISGVYDLTDLGFPSQIGESKMEGPACIWNSLMLYMPVDENWTHGQFDVNQWTAGENWTIDGNNGNPAPTAKFSSQPKLTNYSSKLVSFYISASSGKAATPYCIWLDFDYLLDDISASGTEKLTVEFADGDAWTTLKDYSNIGDVNWTREHINITSVASNVSFRIRFNINGVDSELISYWLVDNIKIYREYGFVPPVNLTAVNTGNPTQNEIQVNWDVPQWENLSDLILDDSIWEDTLNVNPGYSGWLGNKFTASAGNLKSVDVFWMNNINSSHNPLVLDVFDSNHTLLGSSDPFVPIPENWQTIALPEIEVEGDFYAMVRFSGQTGMPDYLGMDSTAPSGRPNNGWFFDGTNWAQLNAFGYAECVFSIRSTISINGNCENGDSNIKLGEQKQVSSNKQDGLLQGRMKSVSDNSGLSFYELYRREYQIPIPGQDSLLSEWQKIATLTTNSYLDQNLEFKCYQYYSQAMYNEGSSVPSNMDEACFLVGLAELEKGGASIYPNPVTETLRIEINVPVESIKVYNSSGREVAEIQVKNGQVKNLDVSNFLPGIYNLKFSTSSGESFNKKFVKI